MRPPHTRRRTPRHPLSRASNTARPRRRCASWIVLSCTAVTWHCRVKSAGRRWFGCRAGVVAAVVAVASFALSTAALHVVTSDMEINCGSLVGRRWKWGLPTPSSPWASALRVSPLISPVGAGLFDSSTTSSVRCPTTPSSTSARSGWTLVQTPHAHAPPCPTRTGRMPTRGGPG